MAEDEFSLAETKQRVYKKFLQKLETKHPGHPWVPEELRNEWEDWKWTQKATQIAIAHLNTTKR